MTATALNIVNPSAIYTDANLQNWFGVDPADARARGLVCVRTTETQWRGVEYSAVQVYRTRGSDLLAWMDSVASGSASSPSTSPAPAAAHRAPANARAEWDAAVLAKVSQGMKHASAVSAVVRENPGLHRRYLAAVNGNAPGPCPRPLDSMGESADAKYAATFEGAIARFMSEGMSRARATSAAVAKYPTLHKQYLAHHNRGRACVR